MLKGKKILLGVTGSIAAYKSALLIRLLVTAGAEVKVIMTTAAKDFISPLTLGTLSKNKVLSDIYNESEWANHVSLGRWADIMLVAPLSCNTLSKMAHGACDNLLLSVYLSATCPVMLAPAMDEDMWKHPSTKENLIAVQRHGNIVLPVESGELASGLIGPGRMAEPAIIIEQLEFFFAKNNTLKGKTILITAGPTHEPLDPVRFIGNSSSGKMGMALAKDAIERGAKVLLVVGPTSEVIPTGVEVTHIKTAEQMYEVCMQLFPISDMAIMCAAVADYMPVKSENEKIKKSSDTIILELKKTKDILKALGEIKKDNQLLVGFALETNNEKENALKKLKEKNADFIVLNSLKDKGAGFGSSKNKITIFDKQGNEFPFGLKPKKEIAADILNSIINNHA
ncbi:MAG: bifunctional phosphopantothenoylcysteine decarboxylase/phosphopantothenate--cysteine ligase CoaBC [Ferruginibacter sp.]